jgi:hypothetical protein
MGLWRQLKQTLQLDLQLGESTRIQSLFFENLTYRFRRDFVGELLNKDFGIHFWIGCPYTLQRPKRLDTEAKGLTLRSFIFAFSSTCRYFDHIGRFLNEHDI